MWAALREIESAAWPAALTEDERARLRAFARFFAAERPRADRVPAEALLERAIVATGYDLAVLARAGGERRLANLRKLMRLAREYEQAEGPDLRGFIAFAATQDLVEAREGEAALESEGLDAVRLMTIHRAKGLEFPVVCVADLGRAGANARERLLLGRDGSVGLRLAPIGGGELVSALDWERLAELEQQEEAEEERRLFYVAMTRACERLILSGGVDCERLPQPRPGGPPIDWIARALTGGDPAAATSAPETVIERGRRATAVPPQRARDARRRAPTRCARPRRARARRRPRHRAAGSPRRRRRAHGAPASRAPAPVLQLARRLRALRLPLLPRARAPAAARGAAAPERGAAGGLRGRVAAPGAASRWTLPGLSRFRPRSTPACAARSSTGCSRTSTSRGPAVPDPDAVRRARRGRGDSSCPRRRSRTSARSWQRFAGSPLCARLAAARRLRREAPFAFGLERGGGGPLINGFLDVVAREPDDGVLIVDYKSDRLEGADPAEIVERDYTTQRVVYALAALRDGAPRVEVAYCFLERPAEPVTRTFTAADEPALAEQLAGLARGVLEGATRSRPRRTATCAPTARAAAPCARTARR